MGIMEDKRIQPDTPEVEENGNSELNMEEAPAAPGDMSAEQLFGMEPDPDGEDPEFSEKDRPEDYFFEEDYSGEDLSGGFEGDEDENSGEDDYPDDDEDPEEDDYLADDEDPEGDDYLTDDEDPEGDDYLIDDEDAGEDDYLADDDHTEQGDSADENASASTASSTTASLSSSPSSLKSPKKAEKARKTTGKTTGSTATGKGLENTLARVQSAPASPKKNKKTVSYKEKILRHKRQRIQREVLLVMMIMYILTIGVLLWMFLGYRHADLHRIASISAEDGTAYANLNGNVVQYGGSGAVCINSKGETLWTVSYEMQQPIVSVSGNVIAIANRNGYYVYVMNPDGLMGTIHTMLPIQNIASAENGEVAVVMSDSRTTWVRLYTAKGKEIAYLVRTMAENGYPIAAAISPDGETLCLSSVQMSSTSVKSNVSFYNFGRAGSKVPDHLVDYSDFIDETIPYVRYLDDSTCVGVSDKRLILFKSTFFHRSGSTNIMFSENLQGVFSSDNFTGLLFTNTSGKSQYRLDIYNRNGKRVGDIHFSMQFTHLAIAGDKVYINNEHECQIYSMNGQCLYDGSFGSSIRALIPGATLNDLMVVTAGEIDSVRLR